MLMIYTFFLLRGWPRLVRDSMNGVLLERNKAFQGKRSTGYKRVNNIRAVYIFHGPYVYTKSAGCTQIIIIPEYFSIRIDFIRHI